MQRFKQPNMDLHPDGEWIRYDDHVEAMKRIAGDAERCKCCGYLVTESEHRGCLRAAAPSANGQQAEPVANHSRVCLSGAQLLEALDFIAPDRDTDREQLESDVTIQYGGGHDGAGYYCWVSDYPEEGAILLDGESASSILAAPAPSASPAKCQCDFDAWQENPYTKVLQKSIREDFVPKADASPAALTAALSAIQNPYKGKDDAAAHAYDCAMADAHRLVRSLATSPAALTDATIDALGDVMLEILEKDGELAIDNVRGFAREIERRVLLAASPADQVNPHQFDVMQSLENIQLPMEGYDPKQPGYERRKGWNDACRYAMDVFRANGIKPMSPTPPAAE